MAKNVGIRRSRGAAWSARLPVTEKVEGSNPFETAHFNLNKYKERCVGMPERDVNKIINDLMEIKPLYPGMGVTFYLYSEPGHKIGAPTLDELQKSRTAVKNTNTACFAELFRTDTTRNTLVNHRNLNRIAFVLTKSRVEKFLTKDQEHRWVELCKEHRLLPHYIKKVHVDNRVYVIDITRANMTLSLLYIYLSNLRDMQEHPVTVRMTLRAVDNHNVNFFVAYSMGTKLAGGGNHNYFLIYHKYGEKKDAESRIPLHCIIGLKKFLVNPRKYDNRNMFKGGPAHAEKTIRDAFGKISGMNPEDELQIKHLLTPEFEQIVNSRTSTAGLKAFLKGK